MHHSVLWIDAAVMVAMVMRVLALIAILVIDGATGHFVSEEPEPNGKPYLTVFTHLDYRQRADQVAFIGRMTSEPVESLKSKVNYAHLCERHRLYLEGRWPWIKPDSFPMAMLQTPQGKVIWCKSSAELLDMTGQELYNELSPLVEPEGQPIQVVDEKQEEEDRIPWKAIAIGLAVALAISLTISPVLLVVIALLLWTRKAR